MTELARAEEIRVADHEIEPLFVRRWSPRAMSGEPLETGDIDRLFEAARWAPSTYNEQEWRFLYARRDTAHWGRFFDLLAGPNQAWCDRAAMLGCVLSRESFEESGKYNRVHTFDSGLAYMSLALQGSEMGLVVHAMMGFDYDAARKELDVPDGYSVEIMFAVGRPGDPDDLPESHREMESPSGRKPVAAIVCEGPFDFDE